MSSSNIEARVLKIVANYFGVGTDTFTKESRFTEDLNGDSFDKVMIVMQMEDEFGIQISDEDANKITTVQEAIDYVIAKHKEASHG